MPLKESGEMYLESIYVLCGKKDKVRSIDVAEYMRFSKPSVSRGVGKLVDQGYISIDDDGYITLTESGENAAKSIFERHTVLSGVLERLGVESDIAAEDACRIEHIISEETFKAIKKYYENLK